MTSTDTSWADPSKDGEGDEEDTKVGSDEEAQDSGTTSKSVVTDMPARDSQPTESWRDIDVKVKKSFLHRLFIWQVYLAVLIHFTMLLSQILAVSIFYVTTIEAILRCYVIAMCICGIFVEWEWTQFIRDSAILHVWITRGPYYSLIGIVALEEIDVQTASVKGKEQIMFFISFMAYCEVALGLLYYVLGCLCVQALKFRVYLDYERRCEEIKLAQKGTLPPKPSTGTVS